MPLNKQLKFSFQQQQKVTASLIAKSISMDPAVVMAFDYWMTYKEKQTMALKVYFQECYILLHFTLFLARV